jgi:hypothetical protein
MTTSWYYAFDGKQVGPVPDEVFRELAASGRLQRTDLVWQEGMPNWLPAQEVPGLFVNSPSGIQTRQENPPAAPAASNWRLNAYDSTPLDRTEPSPSEPSPWLRRRVNRGDTTKTKELATLAGFVVVGLIIVVAVLGASGVFNGGAANAADSKIREWNLASGTATEFRIRFEAGVRAEIWVTSDRDTDVDIFVYDSSGREVVRDDGDSKDCHVVFRPMRTQTYKVVVANRVRLEPFLRHRNGPNSGILKFAP